MCGCTGAASPACCERSFRRTRMCCGVRRPPRWLMKSASPPGAPARAHRLRTASHWSSATSAARPTGTLRFFSPLPNTWASPACWSIQPRALALAFASSPTSSLRRRPQLYSSSVMHWSRASRKALSGVASAAKLASCTASSTLKALGKGRGALGERTPCTGLPGTSPSRPNQT